MEPEGHRVLRKDWLAYTIRSGAKGLANRWARSSDQQTLYGVKHVIQRDNGNALCHLLSMIIIISGLLATATFPNLALPLADQADVDGEHSKVDGLHSHTCSRIYRVALAVSFVTSLLTILNALSIITAIRRFLRPQERTELKDWAAASLVFTYKVVWWLFYCSFAAVFVAVVCAVLQYMAWKYVVAVFSFLAVPLAVHLMTALLGSMMTSRDAVWRLPCIEDGHQGVQLPEVCEQACQKWGVQVSGIAQAGQQNVVQLPGGQDAVWGGGVVQHPQSAVDRQSLLLVQHDPHPDWHQVSALSLDELHDEVGRFLWTSPVLRRAVQQHLIFFYGNRILDERFLLDTLEAAVWKLHGPAIVELEPCLSAQQRPYIALRMNSVLKALLASAPSKPTPYAWSIVDKYLQKLPEGDPVKIKLAQALQHLRGGSQEQAFQCIKEAAASEASPAASVMLGVCFTKGIGVPRSAEEGASWFWRCLPSWDEYVEMRGMSVGL